MKFTISAKEAGTRIDQVLSAHMQGISRSQIQSKLLASGRVFLHGKQIAKNYRVKEGDTIIVEAETEKLSTPSIIKTPRIIFENEDYLVLDKPAGVLVHPARDASEPSLVDFLLAHAPQIKKVGDDPLRPGIVHRLDKEASGVMVIAKNAEMFEVLKKQFKTRTVKKQYLILVYGVPSKPRGQIVFTLARARHSPRIVARASGGRQATTEYWIEKDFGRHALIRVEPHTGRTHQIRVHFFSFGYPIVGDTVYAGRSVKKKIEGVRLMLHATLLGFYDRQGAYREYECLPGEDFGDVVKRMSRSPRSLTE